MRISYAIPFVLLLAACAQSTAPRAIGAPDTPIIDDAAQRALDAELSETLNAAEARALEPAPLPESGKSYNLAQLIDIAQRRNPATRQSWYLAREAGRRAGLVESALLPVISGSALAGTRRSETSLDLPVFGERDVTTTQEGAAVVLSASWLLFDFGENAARQDAADQLARVAELGFNRMHQQVVFDVATAFHARLAALEKGTYARAADSRADGLLNAAQRRLDSGIGNTVEVAQARQLRAQTRLVGTRAAGEARAAAVSLAAALNLPPGTSIRLDSDTSRLPAADDARLEQLITAAYARRPDVLASLAQVRAAQSDLEAEAAAYRPKVFAAGSVASGNGDVGLDGLLLPTGASVSGSSGVFVGLSIPIYDGKLRAARQRGAADRLAAAQSGVLVAQSIAAREIAIAYEELRTALAVHQTTRELVRAASETATAAERAYEGGLGTLSDASAATLGLYATQELLADARFSAQEAASTLALASGR